MDLREQKEALQGLLLSQGWALLRSVLEEQVKQRTQKIILSPLKAIDETLGQEYAKGEAASLQLAIHLPEVMLEEAVNELKALDEEMKNAT